MATYLLKKSFQLKDLKETKFKDLWGDHGVFTTMWIFGKPSKILFFESHIRNLIKSLKTYGITKKSIKKDILKLINKNLTKNKKYNHLLRVALNKKIISISLRKRIKPKLNFDLKLVNLKREKPQYKNLKYKKILSYLSKMDNSRSDIGLVSNKKLLETGTSNLFFVKDNKFFTPKKDYYQGNTFKYFKTKIKRIIKKDIFVKELNTYDEIILIGSGKGVASVKTIKDINWKRKNLNKFNILTKYYNSAIKNSNLTNFNQ
ncbi:aminotransferase class IV [Candidatus Pelagibacter sp. HIMB1483]|uniref:aminotransferase class IV n=1 Tax=Candidatus Pelagibacter sp. HIMB1483 TaxID=3415414 RepID=UPI003F85C92A